MASTTARTTNIIAVCPQNDLDAIRLNIRPFPHGMRFPTPSRPKAPRACTHKSRLVTAKCQCPLWSTLRTQVGCIPRSEKCQNRIRAPQLSDATLTPVFQALPGDSFIVNGATLPKNSALTSAGAELRVANGVTLLAKFDGDFASHSSTYGGTGTFRYRW